MPLWNQLDRPLVLASQSPRRRELLTRMGLRFTVDPPSLDNEDELIRPSELERSLLELARTKAATVASRHPEALVLGCDTVVVVDSAVLGKPRDRADAARMITLLAGRMHEVWSGVAVMCRQARFEAGVVAITRVRFRAIDADEVEEYLSTASYLDKAGAYGIQEAAMCFVDGIDGCYYNVVGLPVAATIGLLQSYQARRKSRP